MNTDMEDLTKSNAADYLDTEELQALYLAEVSKEDYTASLTKALDTVSRARGISQTSV